MRQLKKKKKKCIKRERASLIVNDPIDLTRDSGAPLRAYVCHARNLKSKLVLEILTLTQKYYVSLICLTYVDSRHLSVIPLNL